MILQLNELAYISSVITALNDAPGNCTEFSGKLELYWIDQSLGWIEKVGEGSKEWAFRPACSPRT